MELQLYAGPLTRAYLSQEDEAQAICAVLCAWRDTIAEGLREQVEEEVYWEEAPDLPFLRTEPTWQGWYALLLSALALEQGVQLPQQPGWMDCFEKWPVWQAVQQGYDGAFPALMQWADVYLPLQQPVCVTGPDPADQQTVTLASAGPLSVQLELLGQQLWQPSEDDLCAWYALPAQGDLTTCAKRAYAHLHRALHFALQHGLPMMPEY